MLVFLKTWVQSVNLPLPFTVLEEDPYQALGKFRGNLVDGDKCAGTGGKLNLEFVTVVVVEPLQRFDDQEVRGKPYRSAPVRVAAE